MKDLISSASAAVAALEQKMNFYLKKCLAVQQGHSSTVAAIQL